MHQRAGIRRPRQYIVVKAIPRNESGKVTRHEVVNLSNKIDKLRTIFCDELMDIQEFNQILAEDINDFKNGLEDIDLRTLNFDSLMRMELLVFIETRFDTIISIQELAGYRYLSEIITRITSGSSYRKTIRIQTRKQAQEIFLFLGWVITQEIALLLYGVFNAYLNTAIL